MPQYCCVPNCKNSKGGHTFPKDLILRKRWIVAIKRNDQQTGKLWQPGEHDRVCKDHFTNDDYTSTLLGERKRLKKDVVPSLFKFKKSVCPRRKLKRVFEDPVNPVIFENEENEVINEIIIDHSCVDVAVPVDCEPSQNNNVEIQCHLLSDINSKFSIENFCENPGAIKYYSGFNNYNHFMFFFNLLGPVVFDLNYKCSLLEPKDQLFLTLMKLRQAKEDLELSIFFKVSESTVSQLINVWINFLYFQLKEINIWPEKSIVQETMPSNFKSAFPTTRVVLDATEIPISKPQNVDAQSMTFSTYKNKNTLKTIIGCSPRGLVSYISDSYGGSASDRQIIERSTLVNNNDMFESKDSIMADRGIMVQDIFASKNVFVNTPTMLKGKSQLEPEQVIHDRRIASKRIHVERVIGLGKTYKILKKDLPASKRALGSRIVFVCYMLSNFRPSIVNRLA